MTSDVTEPTRENRAGTLNVTQANLDELAGRLTDFNAAKARPHGDGKSFGADAVAAQSDREANELLRNRMDRMVNLLGRENPDLFGWLQERARDRRSRGDA